MAITSDAHSVTITHPSNPKTSVKILNFGATAISWKVDGVEKLWLSEASKLDGSRAVRGGIPIVFPRFGAATGNHPATDKLPQHGFARSVTWEFLGEVDERTAQFGLGPEQLTPEFREQWGYDFTLLLTFKLVDDDKLDLQLQIENTDSKPFEFTTLLHTYYHVPEVTKTSVDGFNGLHFYNKVLDEDSHSDTNTLTFNGEFDRVYKSTPHRHVIKYENKPLFTIDASPELEDTVVWNPWQKGADSMTDFSPKTGFHQMICVENGAVAKFNTLAPSSKFTASVQITAAKL